jgi:hypothetical protein
MYLKNLILILLNLKPQNWVGVHQGGFVMFQPMMEEVLERGHVMCFWKACQALCVVTKGNGKFDCQWLKIIIIVNGKMVLVGLL